MTKRRITRVSVAGLRRLPDRTTPRAAAGPRLGAKFWRDAQIVTPEEPKRQLTLRLDADLLERFKAEGRGYQTRINAILRLYYDAHRRP
jgi:uncharacterized protein (DUF4415 family)